MSCTTHVPVWTQNVVLLHLSQFLVFFLKAYFWVFVSMWVKATLPRVRVDQLMTICWKYLVPIGFCNIIGTAVWMLVWPQGNRFMEYVLFFLALGIVGLFLKRVVFHLRRAQPELYFKPTI